MIASFLFMCACTFTAARFNQITRAETCKSEHSCSSVNRLINPMHALFPLCVVFGAFVLMDVPMATLPSAVKVRRLKRCASRLLLLTPCLGLLWYAFQTFQTLSTMIVCHSAVFLLSNNKEAVSTYETFVSLVALGVLLVWTVQEGPPVPVFESPGIDVCCGHMTHLVGVVFTHLVTPLLGWFLRQLLALEV